MNIINDISLLTRSNDICLPNVKISPPSCFRKKAGGLDWVVIYFQSKI